MAAGEDGVVSTRTLTVLVYVVTIVWALNIIAPLVITAYQSNTGANGIMGALLGLLGAMRYQKASRIREPKKRADPND